MDLLKLESNAAMLAALAVAVALVYMVKKNGAAANVGEAVGGAVVDLAGGAVAGVALNLGDAFGVPRTNVSKCDKAIAEGRTWDASFACPAGKFLTYANPFSW